MQVRIRARRVARSAVLCCTLAIVAPLVGSVVAGAQEVGQEFTTSTLHVTTTHRTDLADRPASACGAAAVAPTLVAEQSEALDPVESVQTTFGPATIFIGEDEKTPHQVPDAVENFNTRTTYETVVVQTFQGVAAGAPCPAAQVVAAARFTG
jgi:hypothetical protein